MNAWIEESELVDEFEFSGRSHDFHAWNIMSPELEFCNVAGYVTSTLPDDALIVETGMGQGYVTRRVIDAMKPGHKFLSYEHKQSWIDLAPKIKNVDIVFGQPPLMVMQECSFLILDSEPSRRSSEMVDWLQWAKEGSLFLVHDTYHTEIEDNSTTSFIKRAELEGWWLPNPRGSFLGVHP